MQADQVLPEKTLTAAAKGKKPMKTARMRRTIMAHISKKLTAGILLLTLLLGIRILLSAPIKAFASDIRVVLDQEEINLEKKFLPDYTITGKLSGDTSSTYYIYGYDDRNYVTVQEGYYMSGTSFSLRIQARQNGQTSLKIAVKDTKLNKVVAENYVQVTVSTLDASKVKVSCSASGLNSGTSGYYQSAGRTAGFTLTVTNIPAALSLIYAFDGATPSGAASVIWGNFSRNGTTRYGKGTLILRKPGDVTLKYTIKEKTTGTALASCSFRFRIDNSLEDMKSYVLDLADSDLITVETSANSSLNQKVESKAPAGITALGSSWKDGYLFSDFQVLKTGSYSIPFTQYFQYNNTWYEGVTNYFNIKVIDSRTNPGIASQADLLALDEDEVWFNITSESQLAIRTYLVKPFIFKDTERYSYSFNYDHDELEYIRYEYTFADQMKNGTDIYNAYDLLFAPKKTGDLKVVIYKSIGDRRIEEHEVTIHSFVPDNIAADAVSEQINVLPSDITENATADIKAVRAAYQALTDSQKALISTEVLAKLTSAETLLAFVNASQPVIKNAAAGETVSFSAGVSGTGFTYQWQYKSGDTWKDFTSAASKTKTLKREATDARDGNQYRCIVSSASGASAVSGIMTLKVKPTITAQPKSFTGAAGSTAKFTVTAAGNSPVYQWQYKSGDTWKNLTSAGAKTNTLTREATDSRDGYQYRCVIKSASGASVTSNAVTLKVKPTITAQPKSFTGAAGSTAKFTVTATGNGLVYQWQYKSGDTWKNYTSAASKTNTLTREATDARDGNQYRCVIKSASGASVTSNAVTLKVKPTIIAQPVDYKCAVGATAKFTVTAAGNGLVYQWQYKSGDSWKDLTSAAAKTNTLTREATAARSGSQYRCIVKSASGASAVTNTVRLTVK